MTHSESINLHMNKYYYYLIFDIVILLNDTSLNKRQMERGSWCEREFGQCTCKRSCPRTGPLFPCALQHRTTSFGLGKTELQQTVRRQQTSLEQGLTTRIYLRINLLFDWLAIVTITMSYNHDKKKNRSDYVLILKTIYLFYTKLFYGVFLNKACILQEWYLM